MATLLQKAKSVNTNRNHKRKFTNEEKDLCAAWLTDEISLTALTRALDFHSTGQAYVFLATCARQIFQEMGDE